MSLHTAEYIIKHVADLLMRWMICVIPVLPWIACGTVSAHVGLNSPNGGEALEVATSFTIQWYVVVEHDLENWDLDYSISGPSGPWIVVAANLPPGDGSGGAEHEYSWTVPDTPSNDVWVRVTQDNASTDYEAISQNALSIEGNAVAGDTNGDGRVDLADFSVFHACLIDSGDPPTCELLDLDGNGRINLRDYRLFQLGFTGS